MAKKNANSEQRIKKDPRKRTVDIPGLPQDYAIEPERTLEAIPGANKTFTVDCGHGNVAKFVDGRCIFEGRGGEVCKKKTSFDRKGDWIRHCGKHLAKELTGGGEVREIHVPQ
ncbi:uncharacterized protein SCHCODRAFT_02534842 [Schizophyllum commune H4-8]|uniref:Uncharacterized protein n=1 Tax=Schizophyllum commune (strain H4-8 / FGSC 9210) TaxID=578458 RepID=D8Q326_SCHCM